MGVVSTKMEGQGAGVGGLDSSQERSKSNPRAWCCTRYCSVSIPLGIELADLAKKNIQHPTEIECQMNNTYYFFLEICFMQYLGRTPAIKEYLFFI